MTIQKIRDLLYFDIDKASSILSQFDWGLIEQISISQDEINNKSGEAKLSIPQISSAGIGLENQKKSSILETKKIHHDLFNRVESLLNNSDLIVDLNSLNIDEITEPSQIHSHIENKPYISAEGWGFFEDYQKIKSILDNFTELIDFVNQSSLQTIMQSPEFVEFESTKKQVWNEIKNIKDPNLKSKKTREFKAQEEQIEQKIKQGTQKIQFEPWMIDGIKSLITNFMRDQFIFRIYPYERIPSFHIESSLKRDCFVNENLEHLLYGYGNKPNIKLSVFGLITSMPTKENYQFDPLSLLEKEPSESDIEIPLRQLFTIMDQFELLVRKTNYPRITIHPIAVFREFIIKKDNE